MRNRLDLRRLRANFGPPTELGPNLVRSDPTLSQSGRCMATPRRILSNSVHVRSTSLHKVCVRVGRTWLQLCELWSRSAEFKLGPTLVGFGPLEPNSEQLRPALGQKSWGDLECGRGPMLTTHRPHADDLHCSHFGTIIKQRCVGGSRVRDSWAVPETRECTEQIP